MPRIMVVLIAIFLSGCSVYHPISLTSNEVDKSLLPPDTKYIKVQAKEIHHPILKPLEFDDRDGLSPDEAAIFAVIANPELRAIRDRRDIARAQILQAGILPNPQLSATLEIPTGGATQGTINAYGLQLDWDITALISRGSNIRAAKRETESIELSIAWKEWQAAEAARIHWFRLAWLEKKLSLLDEEEELLSSNLEALKKGVSLGVKTGLDIAAAQATLQDVRQSRSALRRQMEKERCALNRSLGLPPDRHITLQRGIDLTAWPPEKISFRDLTTNLEDRRLDLMALRKGYESQEERLRSAILEQFPKIGIGLIRARDTGDVITTGGAVSFSIPLFDRNQGTIAIRRATRKQLYDEYAARIFGARAEIFSLTKELEAIRAELAAVEQAVEAQQKLVDAFAKAIEQGNLDVVSLYHAKKDLIDKRLRLLDLYSTMTDLGVALETASGRIFPVGHEKPHPETRDGKWNGDVHELNS